MDQQITSSVSLCLWIAFWIVILVALFIDLSILNKNHGKVSIKESLLMVGIWVTLALVFGASIGFLEGWKYALEFYAGYVLEYSLSVDNMFVFIIIFSFFSIPASSQPKALLWGILGAIVLRFIFIFIGIKLLTLFSWVTYVFGALLCFTALKMLLQKEDAEFNPTDSFALKLFQKFIPLKASAQAETFFLVERGKRFATPLLAAVFVIELSDIIFALDSIPAVLSITQNTFLVFASNIFAIIGLRSLYFLLSGMATKFEYLKFGISIILLFVGFKMLLAHFVSISIVVSLGIIVSILAISILASKLFPSKRLMH